MSRRQQWKHWQPGGQDPWQHNRDAADHKEFLRYLRHRAELVRFMERINTVVEAFNARRAARIHQEADS